jgi:hypothetical protein
MKDFRDFHSFVTSQHFSAALAKHLSESKIDMVLPAGFTKETGDSLNRCIIEISYSIALDLLATYHDWIQENQ